MEQPTVGLLPHYIELYDRALPRLRPLVESFLETIAGRLAGKGLRVLRVEPCRLREEFHHAVESFRARGADMIVSLHLAYSPSLESAGVLASAGLPVIVLDTTPDYGFGAWQEPEKILYNHGIHGVQDLCNLLLRRGKEYAVEAGHWERSDVLDRVASWARAAAAASRFRNSRVGIVGRPFAGMGDFQVPEEEIKSLGIRVVQAAAGELGGYARNLRESGIREETERCERAFAFGKYGTEALRRAAVSGLAIRKWIENNRLTAFTINFLSVDGRSGLGGMPFLEAGRQMAEGVGYAGEGDILTAALVGALAGVCPEVSFTEMFCPDWEGGSVFLSHMGEMNHGLAAEKPILTEIDFPYTDAGSAMAAFGRYKPGRAAIVNLAPAAGGKFSLIVAPGEILDAPDKDNMKESVRGWFKPGMALGAFLQAFSHAGGTHHSALVYGGHENLLRQFGRIMGWNTVALE